MFINPVLEGIWEGSAWSTAHCEYIPKTALLCNANTNPDGIKFDPGVKSKVGEELNGT